MELKFAMIKKKNIKIFDSEKKKSFAVALIIWLVMNISGWQRLYFQDRHRIDVLFYKGLHLFFLYGIIYLTRVFIKKRNQDKYKTAIRIAAAYFILNIIILITIWPGAFRTDDLITLFYMKGYFIHAWQHFITSLYYAVCLQTLPFATGLIIMQIYIISIIVGYSISSLTFAYVADKNIRKIYIIILFLTVNFLPVLSYVHSGFRIALCSFLEFLFIAEIMTAKKENKLLDKVKLNELMILCILIAVWRTEGVYYVVIFPVLLFFMKKNIDKGLHIYTYCIVAVAAVIMLGHCNNILNLNSSYSLTATFMPLPDLVRIAEKEGDDELLSDIDLMIDTDKIFQNPDETAETLFWRKDLIRLPYKNDKNKEYYNKYYNKYIKAYIKLVIKHPKITFMAMWNNFLASAGITTIEDGYPLIHSGIHVYDDIFEDESEMNRLLKENMIPQQAMVDWEEEKVSKKLWYESIDSKLNEPTNRNLRKKMLRIIGGINNRGRITVLYRIFWNLFIPFILIAFCLLYKLYKKDWFTVFIILGVVGRIPLIFVTSSAPYLMYYLPAYLMSYIVSFFIILSCIFKKYQK